MSNTNCNASKITYMTKKVQFKNPKTEQNNIDDSFDKQLKDAVKSIATVIGDNSNKIESELLNKIDTQNQRSNNEYKETFLTQEATSNLSDILTNMKVINQETSI
ncbi:PREDICTED: uncharacterized protein LOC105364845 [Ceratosolen solmsi marchali]|uniref:Uncharacterized protein LOC105364845 n=1 Tax=Ceratosolen solmsi marchali TaxID=326594 RepID=A0AAJ6YNA0_9HYME|nr:PREDICTED: uncharacterized protein LOC105364845 [Ceratosolen solmsi marchali]